MEKKPVAIIAEDADPLTKQVFYQIIEDNGGIENFIVRILPPSTTMPSRYFVSRLSQERIKNMQWTLNNLNELSKYEGLWVIIANQQVYCLGNNRRELERRTRKDGLSLRDILIEYIDDFDVTYLN